MGDIVGAMGPGLMELPNPMSNNISISYHLKLGEVTTAADFMQSLQRQVIANSDENEIHEALPMQASTSLWSTPSACKGAMSLPGRFT